MLAPLPSQITSLLEEINDPYLGYGLVTAKAIQEIAIHPAEIAIRLVWGYPLGEDKLSELKEIINKRLRQKWPEYEFKITITLHIRRHKVQKDLKPKSAIKNIIAVASGKGGVGKSTVAVNLALSLRALGATVGLLDADIYGPSQPHLLGRPNEKAYTQQKKLIPIEQYGIQSISIGYLVEESAPMIWRGPMVSGALQQLLNDTAWRACDYLIVDLPPGTGDIQLTLAQKIPISGVVIVTTPQDLALLDVKKAFRMFEKVGVPILGMVENMSGHLCLQCGHQEAIFGEGGGEAFAKECDLPLMGCIPLVGAIRASSDEGCPIVERDPHGEVARIYREIARKMGAALAKREVEHSAVLTGLVVEG